MKPHWTTLMCAATGVTLALVTAAVPPSAATDVRVAVEEVGDDRYSAGPFPGGLEIKVAFSGDDMEGVRGVRFRLEEARDNLGNSLLPEKEDLGDFEDPQGSGAKIALRSPARQAASVSLSGTLELFAPKRDPNAVVTVEKALAKLDTPLSSDGLKAASVEVSVLSRKRWAEELEKQKPGEKELAEMRAEAKKKGASDAEIEAGLALLAGLAETFGEVPENGVILSGPRAGMELIESVELLGADGQEIHISSTAKTGSEKSQAMILEADSLPGPETSLRFTLLTEKARISVPFALKEVPLP